IEPYSHIGFSRKFLESAASIDFTKIILDPEINAFDGINYSDPAMRDAREFGVTTVYTSPTTKVLRLATGVVIKTLVSESLRKCVYRNKILEIYLEGPEEYYESDIRMYVISKIRSLYKDFQKFKSSIATANRIFIVANSSEAIEAALHLAEDLKIMDKITIVGSVEAIKLASYLRENKIPIVYGPFWISDPLYLDRWNFNNVVRMFKEGLCVSLSTFHPIIDIKLLQLTPALAIRYDLNEQEATTMFSLNSAKALGIDRNVGSIEVGKDADLVIWEEDAFDMKEGIRDVYINGIRINRLVSIPI
ncbi:MAG TPA: hypothetical protein ENI59_00415, partial [Euryarchaeota archaeon]|nr:hypothetical protein [Euryarchaeota archaeon]